MHRKKRVAVSAKGARPGGGRVRSQARFAVLETSRKLNGPQELVIVVDGARFRFSFRMLHLFAERQAALGIAAGAGASRVIPGGTHDAYRGRVGNKRPETVQVLDRVPADFVDRPVSQQAGFLKAAGRAYAAASAKTASSWLAWAVGFNLAGKGYLKKTELAALSRRADVARPACGGWLVNCGELLAWPEYLERQLDEISKQISRSANPLLGIVDIWHISEWAARPPWCLAQKLLREFARRNQLKTRRTPWPVAVLSGEKCVQPASPEGGVEIAKRILRSFTDDEGMSRTTLEGRYPSHRHVVAWLFQAHSLRASPDGFVFTAPELERYAKALKWSPADTRQPGVKLIKESTGLGRRKAEALRSLLGELRMREPREEALEEPADE